MQCQGMFDVASRLPITSTESLSAVMSATLAQFRIMKTSWACRRMAISYRATSWTRICSITRRRPRRPSTEPARRLESIVTAGHVRVRHPQPRPEISRSTRGWWSAPMVPSLSLQGVLDLPEATHATLRSPQRAYVEDVSVTTGEATICFDDDIFPGYGWMFPMLGGRANVGVGNFERNLPSVQDYRYRSFLPRSLPSCEADIPVAPKCASSAGR